MNANKLNNMETLHVPCEPGEISDGYHTFNELYDHRCTLFLALMASNPALSWISAKHHDLIHPSGECSHGNDSSSPANADAIND